MIRRRARRRNRWFYGAGGGVLYEGRRGRVYEYRDGRLVLIRTPDGVRPREIDRYRGNRRSA